MITLLSKVVADKIAAGEVVDRPLSIVKELVENSIDAGANHITVDIKNGGKSYIRVTDNGCGIYKEELSLAFMRHATSKIMGEEDLERIETLGFRGEALASISAVSKVELVTKARSEKTGSKLVLLGGETVENIPVGCPEGTTLVVSDLFYNTPARLKFMKSDSTETTLIIDFVSKIALAYPEITIRLVSNGTNIFTTQGKGDRLHTILTVYNRETGEGLLPFSGEKGPLKVEGFISKPSFSKSNRKQQVFFVNGRVVSSKVLETGIEEAYFDKMFQGRFPIGFVFLSVDPAKVDVNIHPNKKEVRFEDDRVIKEFITGEVRAALNTKKSIPEIKNKKLELAVENEIEEQVDIKQLLTTIREKEEIIRTPVASFKEVSSVEYNSSPETIKLKHQPFLMDQLKLTGIIFDTYIIATLENTLYMIDQHAAHERIFYEQLMKQYKAREKAVQTLLVPFIINVSLMTRENAYNWLDVLSDAGYDIEEFGQKAYKISGVPAFMSLGEAEDFITYFVENISEEVDLSNDHIIERIISTSCKSAVKGGDVLSMEQVKALISSLSACENPFSCPHGRPTFIKMTKIEIERMFKRV